MIQLCKRCHLPIMMKLRIKGGRSVEHAYDVSGRDHRLTCAHVQRQVQWLRQAAEQREHDE